jgi:hypothetical protein
MTDAWNWLKARLAEPSTWAGLAVGAMAISNGLANKTDLAGLIGGALAAVLSEKSA